MHPTSRRPNERLLQVTRRATFGRAIRPAPDARARESAPVAPAPSEAAAAAALPGDGVEGSRRRSPRVPMSDEIGIRRIGSFNFQADLHDVSTGGCRVELIEQYEVGDPLVARLPKLEPLGATVRWAEGTTAGIEFLSGIHPAVFDSLLMRLRRAPISSSESPATA